MPSTFASSLLISIMKVPEQVVIDAKSFHSKGQVVEQNHEDPFVQSMPQDLNIADCIIDSTKHKNIAEQREYFKTTMLKMANDEGWRFMCKTNM